MGICFSKGDISNTHTYIYVCKYIYLYLYINLYCKIIAYIYLCIKKYIYELKHEERLLRTRTTRKQRQGQRARARAMDRPMANGQPLAQISNTLALEQRPQPPETRLRYMTKRKIP